jgi:hypothetical protein
VRKSLREKIREPILRDDPNGISLAPHASVIWKSTTHFSRFEFLAAGAPRTTN